MANGFFFGNTLSDIQQARTAQAAMDEQRQARQAQQLFATLSQAAKMAADRREAEADRAARLFLGNRGFDIEREKIGVERERTKEILGAMQADRDRLLRDEQLKRAQIEADNQARLEIAKLQFGENNPQLRRQQEEIDYLIDEANSAAEANAAFANSQLAALVQKIKRQQQDLPFWQSESRLAAHRAKGDEDFLAGVAAIGTGLGEAASTVRFNQATKMFEPVKRVHRFRQNAGDGSGLGRPAGAANGLLGPVREPSPSFDFFRVQPLAPPARTFTPVEQPPAATAPAAPPPPWMGPAPAVDYAALKRLMDIEAAARPAGGQFLTQFAPDRQPVTSAWRDYLAEFTGVKPAPVGSSTFEWSRGRQLMNNPEALRQLDAISPAQTDDFARIVFERYWQNASPGERRRLLEALQQR